MGDYSPESPSSAVPVYLFTITLCSPYKYIVEMKTTNPKKSCLRFNFKVCFEQYDACFGPLFHSARVRVLSNASKKGRYFIELLPNTARLFLAVYLIIFMTVNSVNTQEC